MARADLQIDLGAVVANWRALDRLAGGADTGAVVKANAYGLGLDRVAPALARAGARQFFVATAEEGADLRRILGDGPEIFVFAGHMDGDAPLLDAAGLVPLLNSTEQLSRQRTALPGRPYGIQLDTGMNRLGMEADDWRRVRDGVLAEGPRLVMSHLASADEPESPQNARQLAAFRAMTAGFEAPRSLSATGGVLLGESYHFDLVRPGIGLYGGRPFTDARPVVSLMLPVIQTRRVAAGEAVGYNATWHAEDERVIATVSAGYADGLIRSLSNRGRLFADGIACPIVGRVSMDLITVDVTPLAKVPDRLEILGPSQGIDALADDAGTIGYEILTSLGARYERRYLDDTGGVA